MGLGEVVGVGVGVGVGCVWIKIAWTFRSRLIVMDIGFMFTCTVSSRSQWSNVQFVFGVA